MPDTMLSTLFERLAIGLAPTLSFFLLAFEATTPLA